MALALVKQTWQWDYIKMMLPYMTKKGIRKVVRCYRSKGGSITINM